MDNSNTVVYVKVKGKRPAGFVDPPAFAWTSEQEKELWDVISKLDRHRDDIDWSILAKRFNVPPTFLRRRSYALFAEHFHKLEEYMQSSKGESQANGSSDSSSREDAPTVIASASPLSSTRRHSAIVAEGHNRPGTECSSTLGVSISALEEALMNRLELSKDTE